MLPSWLNTKSSNSQRNQLDDISKDSHVTLEPTGVSLQSAARITDDDHDDGHEHINDPSTSAAPIAQDTLETNPFSTFGDVKSLESSTEPPSVGKFLSPHDDILADLQGHLSSGAPPEQQSLRPDAPLGSYPNLGSAVETSLFTAESLPSHEPAKEIMYDPSTGQRLHDYVPTPARSCADEELWSQLSHILELQSEIAKMHVDMENVGLRDARGSGGPERGAKADTARSETGKHRRRNETLGEEENDDETDETEGDESDGDDEVFGKRKREEEFTKLAERFAKRKVAIDSVMDKLDNLSSALKTFHTLPTPQLDLASSRTNTVSSNNLPTTDRGTGVTSTASTPPHDSQRVDSPSEMHPSQSIIDRNLEKI
ncbi:putative protein 17 [Rhizopogon vesiculosus]|uniref:Uncharacterized protein n=1 Tax=Rhizopogon vesiculosus TaxID=180088 RepID=A0A1J8R6L3_9AGAM|nr:putative protein 17 [Rhizopogon vesiculosus]